MSMSKEALAKAEWKSKVLKKGNMTRPYAVALSVSLSFITICFTPTAVEQREAQGIVEQIEQGSSEKSE